jgi:RimJ/RimL family protein N-acetyltransferase
VAEYLHPPVAAPLGDVSTERLHLQRFRPEHLDGLADVFSHREVWKFPYGRGFTREETSTFISAQIDHWQACNFGLWVAIHRELDQIIGCKRRSLNCNSMR